MNNKKIYNILFVIFISWGCMPGDAIQKGDLKSCLNSIDQKLLVSAENPNGFINIEYNRSNNLPLLTLRPESSANLRILSMNVGNGRTANDDGVESAYDLRLTYRTYEDAIIERIRALNPKPQIIAFQEVLTKKRCLKLDPNIRHLDFEKTCWDQSKDQVQRLAGPEYSIVCDGNEGVDCLAVLNSFAKIEGLSGNYNPQFKSNTALLPPTNIVPELFLCDYTKDECEHNKNICDVESSVAYANLKLVNGETMKVVFIHPTAFGEICQQAQMLQTFEFASKSNGGKTLILGDWNMDMVRFVGSHPLGGIFKKYIGPDREFHTHDNFNESCVFTRTSPYNLATLDHVVSNFARGVCRVYQDKTVSSTYYSPLQDFDHGVLDEIFQGSSINKSYKERSFDHHSVICDLFSP